MWKGGRGIKREGWKGGERWGLQEEEGRGRKDVERRERDKRREWKGYGGCSRRRKEGCGVRGGSGREERDGGCRRRGREEGCGRVGKG